MSKNKIVSGQKVRVEMFDDYSIVATIEKMSNDRIYFRHYSNVAFSVPVSKIKSVEQIKKLDGINGS
jgi:hypothetical protein